MEILYVIGIFESFFLALLIFFKKNKSLSELILGTFFILVGINILFSYFEYINARQNYIRSWCINITAPLVILYGTILWFYIKSLTTPKFRFKTVYLLHFLPFIIFLFNHYINFYSKPPAERIQLAITESFKQTFSYKFFVLFISVTIFFYLFWNIKLIKQHEKNIQKYFSNLEKVNLRWLKYLLTGILTVFCLTTGVLVLDLIFHFIGFKKFESFAFGLTSLLILVLGFLGIRQTTIFSFTTMPQEPVSAGRDELFNKLMDVMKNTKPYLDPDLTIGKLSGMLGVDENELSGFLNQRLNKNFFEFINLYRIEEFKEKITNPENECYTILGIASECGFNSKATFNRVFKKFTQTTPIEFKKKYQKN